jgi:hypothetical protein
MADKDDTAPTAADAGQDDLTPKERRELARLTEQAQAEHDERRAALSLAEIDNYERAHGAPTDERGK